MSSERLTTDPTIMGGRPCIRGMRITVGHVVGLAAEGLSLPEILDEYPYLEADDVRDAIAYAAGDADPAMEPRCP